MSKIRRLDQQAGVERVCDDHRSGHRLERIVVAMLREALQFEQGLQSQEKST